MFIIKTYSSGHRLNGAFTKQRALAVGFLGDFRYVVPRGFQIARRYAKQSVPKAVQHYAPLQVEWEKREKKREIQFRRKQSGEKLIVCNFVKNVVRKILEEVAWSAA